MDNAARVWTTRWPVLLIGGIVTALQVAGLAWPAHDAASYWAAAHRLHDLYPATWGHLTYAGPPPVAQAFALVSWLPWEVVLVGWQLLLWWSLWYATRPFTLPVILAGYVGLALDIAPLAAPVGIVIIGNAGMLVTAAVVATVRHPAANAIAALVKVGPAIALLWHAKTPRVLAVGAGVTLAAFAVSFALTPAAWLDWFVFVRDNAGHSPVGELAVPFVVRAPVGVAVVLVAAWTGRAWLVPVGAGLAIPADYGWSWLTVAVGLLGLGRPEDERQRRLGHGHRERARLIAVLDGEGAGALVLADDVDGRRPVRAGSGRPGDGAARVHGHGDGVEGHGGAGRRRDGDGCLLRGVEVSHGVS